MAELMVTLVIVAIMAAISTPFFITYYQSARLRAAAQEVAAFVNQGRQLGIRENAGVCVHITSTAVQHYIGSSCTGAAWIGPSTDATGKLKVPDEITLSATADPVFSYLGAANPGATITVTNSQDGHVLHVTVAVSGRVTIGP